MFADLLLLGALLVASALLLPTLYRLWGRKRGQSPDSLHPGPG
jgi:hypothetical protein